MVSNPALTPFKASAGPNFPGELLPVATDRTDAETSLARRAREQMGRRYRVARILEGPWCLCRPTGRSLDDLRLHPARHPFDGLGHGARRWRRCGARNRLRTDRLEFRGRQALTPESGQLLNLGSLKTHLLAIVRRDPVDHLVVGVHADVKRLVLDRDGHAGLCAQQAALLAEQDLLGRLLAAGRA